MSERRQFTREFKLELVRRLLDGEQSQAQLCEQYDLRRTQLQRWRKQYQTKADQAFPGSGNLSPADSELAELRRQLIRVTAERDILKKAIAICSREQK